MKILHVVNISFVLPYYIGDQFGYMQKKGLKIYVACTPTEHFYEYAEEKDFTAIPINILREINPIADLKAIIILKNKIISENIDIVIGHTPKGAMIGMIAAFLARVNHRIYFRHGLMYETSRGIKKITFRTIEKLTAKLATKVICVSKSVMDKSNKEFLNRSEKNFLINKGTCNGIDLNKFSIQNVNLDQIILLRKKYNISENDIVIGYVGRLVKDKGINELLSAWKLLKLQYSNIKLLMVGPFEERDSITVENMKYIALESSIIHTGLITNVLPYYSLMDIFILPSYREGFPTVVLEASAMEIPIITTMSTGCVDSIVENETGIFTEITPLGILEKIMYYLNNPTIAKSHGKSGREYVINNFRQEIIWNELYEKFLTKK